MKKDVYNEVIKHISRIREQGESPKPDLFSFDAFVCDLCKGVVNRSEIVQCPFCGRWVCREKCWSISSSACISCSSVIKLIKESKKMEKTEKVKRGLKKVKLLKRKG